MDDQLLKTAIEYGVLGLLVWFFVLAGQKREQRMGQRIDEIETYVQDTLSETLKEVTATLTEVTSIVKENTAVMKDNTQAMIKIDKHLEHLDQSNGKP